MIRVRRGIAAVALAALLVTAGCTSFGAFDFRGEPDDDRIGWENGYWHDDSIDVTTDDGLNETEREVVVARTMARVEVIRDREFRDPVPVEVVTRAEFRESREGNERNETFGRWNNQVWEALFLVGETEDVADAFDTVYGESVQGFYSPGRDEIVIVSDAETPTIDTRTLAHELVHALQDQHPDLSLGPRRATQDGQIASDGLVEGDANLVQSLYRQRCDAGWSCLAPPPRTGGDAGGYNQGVFITLFAPYAEGPALVNALRTRSGGDWDAVNDAYDAFPVSSEQVIHPEKYPDEQPRSVSVNDRTRGDWERFDLRNTTDTVGEASLYAMFWSNGEVPRGDRSPYNYSHPASAGWGGDALVPYTNGTHDGYVWKLVFDSSGDAEEFARAYRDLLESRGARAVRDGVYRIPDGPFTDAFHVDRAGDTVVITNAPTVRALDRVRD